LIQRLLPGADPWQRLLTAFERNSVAFDRRTFRTTFREIRSSRQIALIDFP
jgi:hypothetical protein